MDLQGREVARLMDQEWLDSGKYLKKVETGGLALRPGAYFLVLKVDGAVEKRKVMVAN